MQSPNQVIQLSGHVRNKLREHETTPFSMSSDELILSETTDDEDDDVYSLPAHDFSRKRSNTFTTYEIQEPSKPESFYMIKRMNSDQNLKRQQLCQECVRRQNLLQNEQQRLLRLHDENRKLSEQLRSSVLLNHQYQEENYKLKLHLTKMNTHLREYQTNFDVLKQKLKSKQDVETDQLKRLRHEVQVYNQVIALKRQEEQKQINFYSHQNWTQKKY